MKSSAYIETTIVSYLTASISSDLISAAHQRLTQRWWESRRRDFKLFISEFVIQEASAGDPEAGQKRLAALSSISLLDVSSEVEKLAQSFILDKVLPAKAATDALHVAIAAVHGIDFLLTWNCRHLANAELIPLLVKTCSATGYQCPYICTPEELMGGEANVE